MNDNDEAYIYSKAILQLLRKICRT